MGMWEDFSQKLGSPKGGCLSQLLFSSGTCLFTFSLKRNECFPAPARPTGAGGTGSRWDALGGKDTRVAERHPRSSPDAPHATFSTKADLEDRTTCRRLLAGFRGARGEPATDTPDWLVQTCTETGVGLCRRSHRPAPSPHPGRVRLCAWGRVGVLLLLLGRALPPPSCLHPGPQEA